MTDKSKLFGIGDVARLFHVSVSTLRHYENEGLLMPEYTDPRTGYRYYSPRQFEVLNTIRYLRVLDMPLAEIADFLGKRDVDRIEEKLRQQKNALAAKQRELARIERKIDNRLRGIADAKTAPIGVITRSTVPAARIVWMSMADSLRISDALDMETPIQDLARNTDEAMVFLGKVGVGIDPAALEAGRFDEYDRVFLLLEEGDACDGAAERIPAGPCVTVRFRGSHREAPERYRRIMAWLRARGLRPARPSREITLIDDGLTRDPAQFVTEIALPVARDERGEGDA